MSQTSEDENVFEEFASLGIGQLKDYLSARGLLLVGNKNQLVSRSYVAWETKVPLKETEKERQSKLREEYEHRLKKINTIDPRSIEEGKWSADVKEWPNMDLGKIFSYIIANKEHELEYVGRYKTKKAYSYYSSGFVDIVKTYKNEDIKLIKSRVTPSQSVRNEPHDVWIGISVEGDIICGWCNCIAGMAQTCNHIIAVLYKLEYASTNGYNSPACTSLPCNWNSSTRKDVQPSRLSAMNIRQDNRSKISGNFWNIKCCSDFFRAKERLE